VVADEGVAHVLDRGGRLHRGENGVVVEDGDAGHGAAHDTLAAMNRRPQLQIVAPGACAEEAAAVVAAIERFLRDTAPAVAAPAPAHDPWLRAALLENTGREPDAPSPWGDPHPWG
jgi:hypothetical protein